MHPGKTNVDSGNQTLANREEAAIRVNRNMAAIRALSSKGEVGRNFPLSNKARHVGCARQTFSPMGLEATQKTHG